MHHLTRSCFNKSFSMGSQPCLFYIVNKHLSSNFKFYKTFIEFLLKRTIHQTPSCFHDIISCIFWLTRVLHSAFTLTFLSMWNRHNKLVDSGKTFFTAFINVESLSVTITWGIESRLRKIPRNRSRVQTTLFIRSPSN